MRRSAPAAAALALAAACSSGSGTSTLSSPSPLLSTSLSPTMLATTPPASPSATRAAAASASPTARRTASPTPSPTRSRTPSPRPSPTRNPAPTGKTFAISEVTLDRFSPSTLSLHRGDSVLVTNKDSTDHTFTISSLGKDSGNMTAGDSYRLTFSTSGTFNFVCTYHESLGMKGTITVA